MLYYHTPPGDLLQAPPPTADGITEANEKGRELRRVFGALGVPLKFIKGVAAPQIIIWHFDLIRLADFPKIKRLLPTVSAALRCPVVQMSSPLAAVAFALPRTPRQVVHVQSVLTSEEFAKAFNGQSVLPAVVGVSSDNKPILIDFADIPHILIAGTTGSGKSTAANSIITSLLYQSPNRCRLIMIDPKKVEFSIYKDLPHLLAPIATSQAEALHLLKEACRLMDSRYKELEQEHRKSIDETDKPHIIIAVDELAEIMLTDNGEAEKMLIRLAQVGRAAGIHLLLCTQRPSRAIIPGLLSANIPYKIALQCSSIRESVVILDHKGAETLTGRGDALIKTPKQVETIRTQTAYTTAADVQKLAEWWRTSGQTTE